MNLYDQLKPLDFLVMIAYLAVVVSLGAWVSFRGRRSGNLFLAERSLTWPSIGLTMWGTNVGPSMLVASAGIGYTTGVVAGNFSWLAFPFILLLAFVFAPHFLRTRTSTLPEYVGRRFDASTRRLLAWYSLVTILFSWLGITLYAGGLLVSQIMHWPLWVSVSALTLVSAFFTVAGGLRAIAATNVFQMGLLILASAILVGVGLDKAGGLSAVVAAVPPDYWRLFLPADNPEFPWYALLLGYPVLGIWFWCTDQSMVQSVLGARDLRQGQLGTCFASWLKILDVPLFILPGVLCFVLFPGLEDPNEAYLTMVGRLLPPGLVGLIITVIMAALVSTVASALNSLSTIFTLDLYRGLPSGEAGNESTVRIGRLAAAVGAGLGVLVALGIAAAEGMNLFSLFQTILGFLAPPISAVFLVGIAWRGASPAGANAVLTFGTATSLGIGALYFAKFPSPEFWPHFLVLSFLICAGLCVFMIAVSRLRPVSSGEGGAADDLVVGGGRRHAAPISSAVRYAWGLLVVAMIALYVFFN